MEGKIHRELVLTGGLYPQDVRQEAWVPWIAILDCVFGSASICAATLISLSSAFACSVVGLLLLVWPAHGQSAVREIIRTERVSPRSFADAANELMAMGETKATKMLKSMAPDPSQDVVANPSINVRIGWLVRLIYVPNQGSVLQPPPFGALRLPVNSMPLTEWPEYPLVISDGVAFVLNDQYEGSGPAPDAIAYLDYCRKEGHFRDIRFQVPTRADADRALLQLFGSDRWKNIKWSYRDPSTAYKYSRLEVEDFLTSQAECLTR